MPMRNIYSVTCIQIFSAMAKYLILFCCLFSFAANGQQIKAYKANDIIQRASSRDTLYIINFWATWCAPCVGELSEFNTLEKRYKNKPVKVILVSLDFKEDYNASKLEMFIARKRLTPEVVWLADTDPNVFIPQIDKSWQGSIPATVMVYPQKNYRQFIEGTITAGKIGRMVDGWLK